MAVSSGRSPGTVTTAFTHTGTTFGALNALGTKINSILATLEAFGFHATS